MHKDSKVNLGEQLAGSIEGATPLKMKPFLAVQMSDNFHEEGYP